MDVHCAGRQKVFSMGHCATQYSTSKSCWANGLGHRTQNGETMWSLNGDFIASHRFRHHILMRTRVWRKRKKGTHLSHPMPRKPIRWINNNNNNNNNSLHGADAFERVNQVCGWTTTILCENEIMKIITFSTIKASVDQKSNTRNVSSVFVRMNLRNHHLKTLWRCHGDKFHFSEAEMLLTHRTKCKSITTTTTTTATKSNNKSTLLLKSRI